MTKTKIQSIIIDVVNLCDYYIKEVIKTRIDANAVRRIAKQRGMSLSQLALVAGFSRQYLYQALTEGNMSDDSFVRLVQALKVPDSAIGQSGGRKSSSVRVNSKAIEAAMTQRKLKITDLARASGLSCGSITRMRSENVLVRRSSIKKLSRALRVEPRELIQNGKEDG